MSAGVSIDIWILKVEKGWYNNLENQKLLPGVLMDMHISGRLSAELI